MDNRLIRDDMLLFALILRELAIARKLL